MGAVLAIARRFISSVCDIVIHYVTTRPRLILEQSDLVEPLREKSDYLRWRDTLNYTFNQSYYEYLRLLRKVCDYNKRMRRGNKEVSAKEITNWEKYCHLVLDRDVIINLMATMPQHIGDDTPYHVQYMRWRAFVVMKTCIVATASKKGLTTLKSFNSPNVLFPQRELSDIISFWSRLWNNEGKSEQDRHSRKKVTEIIAILLRFVQYQEEILNIFNTKYPITYADEAKKYLVTDLYYRRRPLQFFMRPVNLIAIIPNLLSYVIRSITVLINAWLNFDCERSEKEFHFCIHRWKTLVNHILRCDRVELRWMGIERFLRVAIYAMIDCEEIQSEILIDILRCVNLILKGNKREWVRRKQYFMDWVLPGNPVDETPSIFSSESRTRSIQEAMLDNSRLEELHRTDLDVLGMPDWFRKSLNDFTDWSLCFVPITDCLQLLEEHIARFPNDRESTSWARILQSLIATFPNYKN